MNFIKTPVKGMPEQLPASMELREYIIRKIKDNYKQFGFSLISTPHIEHIENLTGRQGGENEQLIFKILKRGEKLEKAEGINDLCDMGLRYDLTVPLARFYANNSDKLTFPFKAVQVGDVFRADRPQKGRFRQFTQCDIDIIGDNTVMAEIELITATMNMLNQLGLEGAKVRINDRCILKAMALSCDFDENNLDNIYIVLDKMDKIGTEGVVQNLLEMGYDKQNIEKYCEYFNQISSFEKFKEMVENNQINYLDKKVVEDLQIIIDCVNKVKDEKSQIVFDPTLVRGMSYYTGPIFEIELMGYGLSVAGGGRYDKMIGKFCGKDVPACGFSIGLERIISIITENNLIKLENIKSTAILVAKDLETSKLDKVFALANLLRKQGQNVMVAQRNNNVRFQKDKLIEIGYNNIIEMFNDTNINNILK